jgi:hypothetical protein
MKTYFFIIFGFFAGMIQQTFNDIIGFYSLTIIPIWVLLFFFIDKMEHKNDS